MLTPQQITELAETLYPALDDLNRWITLDMIQRFMARLGRGEDAVLSGTDRWQAEVYQAAGGHLEELQKKLKLFTKQSDAEIAAIFEDAAVKAWAADCAVYAAAGHDVQPLALSSRMVRILQDAYTRTQGEAHNFTRTTASASQKRLFKVLDETHFKVVTGAQSYTAAVQEAVDDLVQHQTHVVYPTGHRDTIETAVLRAVRTGISQATGNMTMQGMIDHDWDIIRASAHRGARYGDGGQTPATTSGGRASCTAAPGERRASHSLSRRPATAPARGWAATTAVIASAPAIQTTTLSRTSTRKKTAGSMTSRKSSGRKKPESGAIKSRWQVIRPQPKTPQTTLCGRLWRTNRPERRQGCKNTRRIITSSAGKTT